MTSSRDPSGGRDFVKESLKEVSVARRRGGVFGSRRVVVWAEM